MHQEWPIFEVRVDGYDGDPWPPLFTGATMGKARWAAYQAWTSYCAESFGDFLARGVHLRKLDKPPAEDGYDYVRSAYDVHPKIGRRARLVNEGVMNGRCGTVIYPGRSTAHVILVLDGEERPSSVHPMNVEWIET